MVFIIAEIGTNHTGSIDIAKKIIDLVVQEGCDAVKFQKKNVEKIYTKEFLDSPIYSPWGTSQREMRLHREFSDKQFNSINTYCKKKKIPWFVSCWDTESQLQMRKFKTKFNKVASAMLIHKKLLKLIAEEKKKTFISTGMSTIKEIKTAVDIFRKADCPFELMHSNSSYPTKPAEANLKMIQTLKRKFHCSVGYSGHEASASVISLAAVFLGATSIERHVTIERTMYGYDQAASLGPDGLHRLVSSIRLLENKDIWGDGIKRIYRSEYTNMKKLRQKFV